MCMKREQMTRAATENSFSGMEQWLHARVTLTKSYARELSEFSHYYKAVHPD